MTFGTFSGTCTHGVSMTMYCPHCEAVPISTYAKDHADLVAYLQLKVKEKDWHGVSDAANDLRVMEAKR